MNEDAGRNPANLGDSRADPGENRDSLPDGVTGVSLSSTSVPLPQSETSTDPPQITFASVPSSASSTDVSAAGPMTNGDSPIESRIGLPPVENSSTGRAEDTNRSNHDIDLQNSVPLHTATAPADINHSNDNGGNESFADGADNSSDIFPELFEDPGNFDQTKTNRYAEIRSKLTFMKPFPIGSAGYKQFVLPEYESKLAGMAQEPVLLIACDHKEMLDSVMFRIANAHFEFGNHTKLVYIPDSKGEMLDFRQILNSHLDQRETLSFIPVTDRELMESMLRLVQEDSFSFQRYCLRANRCCLVCMLYPSVFDQGELIEKEAYFWNIKFLRPLLLVHANGSLPSVDKVESDLSDQKQRWGKTSREFYQEVTKFLNQGYQRLVDEIERRGQVQEASTRNLKLITAKDNKPVEKAVLLTGAFFSRLSLTAFNLVTCELLEDCRLPVEETKEESNKQRKKRKRKNRDENEPEPKKNDPETARAYWEQSSDRILRECQLRMYTDSEGRQFVDFEDNQCRDQVRQMFEEEMPNYLLRQFEHLYRSGLIFNPQTPESVVTQLVKMAARMASSDPDSYGVDWLMGIVESIREFQQITITQEELESIPEEILVAVKFQQYLEREGRSSFFWARLGELCDELLRRGTKTSEKTVDLFLDRLMKGSQELTMIVWRLVARLRWVPTFNYHRWMRRLFDQGTRTIWPELQRCLLREAIDNFPRVAPELLSWCSNEKDANSLSHAGHHAVAFIFEFYQYSRFSFLEMNKRVGEVPHPVFPPAITISEEACNARVSLLADWLLQPNLSQSLIWVRVWHGLLPKQFLHFVHPSRDLNCKMIAEVLEGWVEVAEIIGEKKTVDACYQLASEIANRTKGDQKRVLRQFLNAKAEVYLKHLTTCPYGEEHRDRRKGLKSGRQRVRQIRDCMK